jgi:hypothetical protein
LNDLQLFLLPAFLQVALTISVLLVLGARRRAAFTARKVGKDAMLNDRAWPDDVLKASNNYKSQFELPVLFFAASTLIVAMYAITPSQILFAWVFIFARVAHTAAHLWKNTLSVRFLSFFTSLTAVTSMWVFLAARVFWGG